MKCRSEHQKNRNSSLRETRLSDLSNLNISVKFPHVIKVQSDAVNTNETYVEKYREITNISLDDSNINKVMSKAEDCSNLDNVENKGFKRGKKSYSFAGLLGKFTELCYITHNYVMNYTFIRCHFLISLDSINKIEEVWEWEQDKEQVYLQGTHAYDLVVRS